VYRDNFSACLVPEIRRDIMNQFKTYFHAFFGIAVGILPIWEWWMIWSLLLNRLFS